MKKPGVIVPVSLVICIAVLGGCGRPIVLKARRAEPVRALDSYQFDPGAPLASRIAAPPQFLLSYLKNLDNSPGYEPYLPDMKEMESIRGALAELPPLHKRVMQERLIGMYFIKNFRGSGLTDWVVDSKNNIYGVMVFNASVLTKTISSLLTERERTCFVTDDTSYGVTIDCGTQYGGFMYILLHESTHLVDYVRNITPYTEREYQSYLRIQTRETAFTKQAWKDYDAPLGKFMFSGSVAFYGFSAPRLRISDAERVYAELCRSPFVSLYGSQSWAEDLAETMSFYHMTRVLKQPLVITVSRGGKKILSVFPASAPGVKKRFSGLTMFYGE